MDAAGDALDHDTIPDDHPRAASLRARRRLASGVDAGIVHREGLIAHGRGEAFDYLLGETTTESADRAARAAAAHLLLADHPVVSVNGNVAALAPDAVADLASAADAAVEVNLFHRDPDRVAAIADRLREAGVPEDRLLTGDDARVPGVDHDRARVDSDGIAAADVVVVPLEDGDRTAVLADAGVTTIAVDLNPLSRTATAATVPVVDEVTRALPRMAAHVRDLSGAGDPASGAEELPAIVDAFDAGAALDAAERRIREGGADGADGDEVRGATDGR
jgi:4-phosphopantoate--beta-alanine ligase